MADASSTASSTRSEAEWKVRRDLAAAYRMVALFGWDDLIFTHISARVPGEPHFLINPYGLLFEEITASSLVKIDHDGNKVDDSPHPVNPAGFVIHSAIHGARADAHAVMHLHSHDGQAVSAQAGGGALNPASDESIGFTAQAGAVGLPFVGRQLLWPALLRKLDRVAPDYRD